MRDARSGTLRAGAVQSHVSATSETVAAAGFRATSVSLDTDATPCSAPITSRKLNERPKNHLHISLRADGRCRASGAIDMIGRDQPQPAGQQVR